MCILCVKYILCLKRKRTQLHTLSVLRLEKLLHNITDLTLLQYVPVGKSDFSHSANIHIYTLQPANLASQ